MAVCSDLSNSAQPGSREWLKYYKKSVKHIKDNMNEAEMLEMQQELVKWEEEGMLADMQAK